MENIFFLVLLAVVGLVRWLSQMAEDKKNAEAEKRAGIPPNTDADPVFPRPAAQTEEERIRRFMEALGVPTSSSPPPKVQPRPTVPKAAQPDRKFLPVDPFPVPRSRVPEQRPPVVTPTPSIPVTPQVTLPPPLPTRSTLPSVEPPGHRAARPRSASEFEVQDIWTASDDATADGDPVATPHVGQKGSIAARLADVQGLRDAIVLREIFGPPRSMQPIDAGR